MDTEKYRHQPTLRHFIQFLFWSLSNKYAISHLILLSFCKLETLSLNRKQQFIFRLEFVQMWIIVHLCMFIQKYGKQHFFVSSIPTLPLPHSQMKISSIKIFFLAHNSLLDLHHQSISLLCKFQHIFIDLTKLYWSNKWFLNSFILFHKNQTEIVWW